MEPELRRPTGASLSGIYPARIHPALGASLATDSFYSGSNGTASLTVNYATCTGPNPGGVILPPINQDARSVWRVGSTVPVKFTVCGANGQPTNLRSNGGVWEQHRLRNLAALDPGHG